MNRSILIVICDFLLVSLLAFSTVDINKVAHPGGTPQLSQPAAATPTNQASGRQDLGDVMLLALNEERKAHDQLVGELTRTRAVVTQQDEQIQNTRNQLLTKEQEIVDCPIHKHRLQISSKTDRDGIQMAITLPASGLKGYTTQEISQREHPMRLPVPPGFPSAESRN